MSSSATKNGIDTLLSQQGKSIQPGQEVRLTLIKTKSGIVCADPVHPKAPPETFPLIAKFPESVTKPELAKKQRLYQQDIPKAQDDSDDESPSAKPKKRRWRGGDAAPKRQWILQQETEFLETMVAKRQRKPLPSNVSSSYYEGFPEHNPSHYALLGASSDGRIEVTTLSTPYGVQTFTQPRNKAALSLTQAEQVIQDQRAHMSRYMMHSGKGRLLGKLNTGDDEEEDVMADVAFKNRKGAKTQGRSELFSSMADEGIKVDDDGVLGGTNDAQFGGRRRFARMAEEKPKNANAGEKTDRGGVGNDGLAMSEDFYHRDVMAEYEDLDYDPNEQFDDDDVDVGEKEVVLDATDGFPEDDVDSENEEYDDTETGAEGLASITGFKKLLAKAKGETPHEEEETDEKETKKAGSRPTSPKTASAASEAKPPPVNDTLAQVMAAAEKSVQAANPKKNARETKPSGGVEVDEHGQRVLTLDAIRKEIWLQNGAITMKKLMKIFDVKKKSSAERQGQFRKLVKELCTMEKDPVQGNILVLKQHYQNMG